MLEWISWFGISLIYNVIYSYLYSKLNETEFAKINLKNIMIYIFVSFMYCVSLTFEVKVTMILFKLLWTIILLKFLYKDDLNKVSITSLLIYILFSIGEIVFSILFVYLLGINLDFCKNNVFGIIFTNFSIGVLNCLVFRIGIINKCVKNIIKFYVSKRYINFIFVTISSIFIIYFFIYQNYTGSIFRSNYLTVFSFFFFIIVFIIGYFKEKTDNNKLTTEYDQLIDYVKTYEEIIEEKSKNQHEYNNQLILIREMLGTRNKKTREYIDGILSSEKGLDESNWLNKFKNIPNGGLKGLIHYKVSEMLKKGIKVYIDINENVNTKKINAQMKS